MICLAIDTSGPNCAVWLGRATADDGELATLAEQVERIGRGHAERLMPMVEEALRSAGLAFADLDRIAVATGPGSFTGVRVGVAAARGLALALGIPALGIDSLETLAAEARQAVAAATVIAALPAPRGEVFAFAADTDGATRLKPSLVDPAELARSLGTRPGGLLALIGSGSASIAGHLVPSRSDIQIIREADAPEVGWIGRLALAGAGLSPPRPLYLRPPDAKPQTARAVARAR
jgi:tRNA threonylcarbamoyladenosine biosynthesis protein TsaB